MNRDEAREIVSVVVDHEYRQRIWYAMHDDAPPHHHAPDIDRLVVLIGQMARDLKAAQWQAAQEAKR